MAKKIEWHRIATSRQLQDNFLQLNTVKTIGLDNKKICLGRLEDGYYAVADKCPHAGGSLGEGACDARGNVICPYHRHGFKLRDGLPASGRGYYVDCYPVEIREDGLYVGIARKGWW